MQDWTATETRWKRITALLPAMTLAGRQVELIFRECQIIWKEINHLIENCDQQGTALPAADPQICHELTCRIIEFHNPQTTTLDHLLNTLCIGLLTLESPKAGSPLGEDLQTLCKETTIRRSLEKAIDNLVRLIGERTSVLEQLARGIGRLSAHCLWQNDFQWHTPLKGHSAHWTLPVDFMRWRWYNLKAHVIALDEARRTTQALLEAYPRPMTFKPDSPDEWNNELARQLTPQHDEYTSERTLKVIEQLTAEAQREEERRDELSQQHAPVETDVEKVEPICNETDRPVLNPSPEEVTPSTPRLL